MVKLAAPITAGLTLLVTFFIKRWQVQAAAELQKEASEVQAFDLFNPATWGAVGANITQLPEAAFAFLKFQALTVLMWLVLIAGSAGTVYFILRDFFGAPRVTEVARRAAELTPAGQVRAIREAVTPSRFTSFERGTKARAVRDVLAKRIEKGGGAREPFAVATARVKEVGPEKAAKGLPKEEIAEELAEQKEEARGSD